MPISQKPTIDEVNKLDDSLIWYHTFFIKDGKLVHTEEEADIVLNGVWCHNDSAPLISKEMVEISGSTIIDVGTCNGFFTSIFEDIGASTASADVSDKEQRKLIKKLLSHDDRFIHENIYQLHKAKDITEPFDYVWCQDLFCHLEHPILALRVLREICKKKIFISTDRFECTVQNGKIYFQARWHDVNDQSICHYYNNDYTYSYSDNFLKKILTDCGFTGPRKKFSYFVPAGKRNGHFTRDADLLKVGSPTKEECTAIGRWVDVYEAEVNPNVKGLPPNKLLDWKV